MLLMVNIVGIAVLSYLDQKQPWDTSLLQKTNNQLMWSEPSVISNLEHSLYNLVVDSPPHGTLFLLAILSLVYLIFQRFAYLSSLKWRLFNCPMLNLH